MGNYFGDRDSGTYAAIFADAAVGRMAQYVEGKYRTAQDCRGRHIWVWKQSKSTYTAKKHDVMVMRALAKGLVLETGGCVKEVRDNMNTVFGGSWAVVKFYKGMKWGCNYHHQIDHAFSFVLSAAKWVFWKTPL